MGKKTKVKKSNLLYQRLQEALDRGTQVWIETEERSFSGVPINLNREFVEILVLGTFYEDEQEEASYESTAWLIRLSSISAIAYRTESWSTDQLENLFGINASNLSPED